MATEYLLLPQRRWDSEFKGPWFQIGGRRNWTFTLRLSSFPVAGSAEVVIEVAPIGLESDWRQLVTFGVQTGRTFVEKLGGTSGDDFSVDLYQETFVRAHILPTIRGIAILECRARAPFFDIGDAEHRSLLSDELLAWDNGSMRIIEQSEEEIMLDIVADATDGRLEIDLERPGATEAIRREVALQAEHNRRRALLERSSDPSALVSLRALSRGVPGRGERLAPFYYDQGHPWHGR